MALTGFQVAFLYNKKLLTTLSSASTLNGVYVFLILGYYVIPKQVIRHIQLKLMQSETTCLIINKIFVKDSNVQSLINLFWKNVSFFFFTGHFRKAVFFILCWEVSLMNSDEILKNTSRFSKINNYSLQWGLLPSFLNTLVLATGLWQLHQQMKSLKIYLFLSLLGGLGQLSSPRLLLKTQKTQANSSGRPWSLAVACRAWSILDMPAFTEANRSQRLLNITK